MEAVPQTHVSEHRGMHHSYLSENCLIGSKKILVSNVILCSFAILWTFLGDGGDLAQSLGNSGVSAPFKLNTLIKRGGSIPSLSRVCFVSIPNFFLMVLLSVIIFVKDLLASRRYSDLDAYFFIFL
jgi:hypothetical protein